MLEPESVLKEGAADLLEYLPGYPRIGAPHNISATIRRLEREVADAKDAYIGLKGCTDALLRDADRRIAEYRAALMAAERELTEVRAELAQERAARKFDEEEITYLREALAGAQ